MPKSNYRPLLILFFCVCFLPLSLDAKVYTIKTIPNIYQQSGLTYVSNPDQVISEEDEYEINSKLIRLEKELSNEVVVVAVNSIGTVDSKVFAHKLFNLWKIGKKETNNGLLILLVVDKREVVFETGTGLQNLMTDEICYEIQQKWMIPLLKESSYSEGLLAGVYGVINFLKTGSVSQTVTSTANTQKIESDVSIAKQDQSLLKGLDIWYGLTFLIVLLTVIPVMLNSDYHPVEKKKRLKKRVTKGCFWLFFLGFNVIGILLLIIIYRLYIIVRNPKYRCMCCGSYKCKDLHFDSQKDYLTPEERDNEKKGICEYSVVVCKSCNYYNKREKVAPNYVRCPSCNKFVLGMWIDNIITFPTTEAYGKKERTLKCNNCNTISNTQELITPLSNNRISDVTTDRGFEIINNISNNSIYVDDNGYSNYNRYYTNYGRRNSRYSSYGRGGGSSYINTLERGSTSSVSREDDSRGGGSSSGGGARSGWGSDNSSSRSSNSSSYSGSSSSSSSSGSSRGGGSSSYTSSGGSSGGGGSSSGSSSSSSSSGSSSTGGGSSSGGGARSGF